MKEKLLERLELLNKAVTEQNQKVAQETANLHMLNGCRQELVYILNLADVSDLSDGKEEPTAEPTNHDECNHDECRVSESLAA